MRVLALATVLASLVVPAIGAETPALSAVVRCDISTKFACSPSGCTKNALGVWNLIDIENSRFSRCDRNGCDEYAMSQTVSGAFTNIEVPGRGMLAKLSLDGSQFVEVVTLGTGVLISYGACR